MRSIEKLFSNRYVRNYQDSNQRISGIFSELNRQENEVLSKHQISMCKILDYGCGDGSLREFLNTRGSIDYVGYDPSLSFIDSANTKYPGGNFISSLEKLELGTFDYVYLLDVLNMIDSEEVLAVLQKFFYCLKMEGSLSFTNRAGTLYLDHFGKSDTSGSRASYFQMAICNHLCSYQDYLQLKLSTPRTIYVVFIG